MVLIQLLLPTSAAGADRFRGLRANVNPAGVLAEQPRRLAEPGLAETVRE